MTNKDTGKVAILESLKMYAMRIFEDKLFEDSERFADILEELDDQTGFLGDDRVQPMYELDDYMYGCGACEIIERCQDVNIDDEYFYVDSWDEVHSTNERDYEDYENADTIQEIVDNADVLMELFNDDEKACIEVMWMLDSYMTEIRVNADLPEQTTETVDDATVICC